MRRVILSGFLGFAVTLVVPPAQAGMFPFSWCGEQSIENTAGHGAFHPDIAVSGKNAVAVWDTTVGNIQDRVYSNYSRDGGATWHTEQLIDDVISHGSFNPRVAISGNNVVAVWSQYNGSGYFHIYANYSSDGGATWHSSQPLEETTDGSNWFPRIGISGSNVLVAWDQAVWIPNGDGSYVGRSYVYCNYSSDAGITWHSAQRFEDGTWFSDMDISGSDAMIAFEVSDGGGSRIGLKCSSDGGGSWSSKYLTEGNGQYGSSPQIACHGGTVVVVWTQFEDDGTRIWFNCSVDGGATWDLSQPISDHGWVGCPNVVVSDRDVVATWYQSWHQSAGEAFDVGVYSRHSRDCGVTWGAVDLHEIMTGSISDEPRLSISGRAVLLVWPHSDGATDSIHASCSVDGGATWFRTDDIDEDVELDSHLAVLDPRVVISGANAVVIWDDGVGNERDAYVNTILLPSKGNVNCDDAVSIADALLCLRMALWLPIRVDGETYHFPYPEELRLLADMDNDEMVSILDTIACLRLALNPAGL